ncbi:YmfQ family protein [Fusobacterium nucleatum]
MSNFKDVNLYNNLPDFMQQYKEIQAIFNIENIDLTKLWNEIRRSFNNSFIFTTDVLGISKFEKMMNIYPKATDSLKDRQLRVYIKWNAILPYTWKWLEEFLITYYQNVETKAIPVLFNNKYELNIRLEKQKEFDNFDYGIYGELRPIIPANLGLKIINVIPDSSEKINVISMVVYRAKKVLKENSILSNLIGEKVFNNSLIYRLKKEV